MAARKQLFHPDVVKQKIQASQLINRLQNHALCTASDPDYENKMMTAEQVRAAFGLLAKVVPDQKPTDGNGDATDKLELVVKIGGDSHS